MKHFLQTLPPLAGPNYIRVRASDGGFWDIPENRLASAREIDPELRTVPSSDYSQIVLTVEDRAFLWELGIVWRD